MTGFKNEDTIVGEITKIESQEQDNRHSVSVLCSRVRFHHREKNGPVQLMLMFEQDAKVLLSKFGVKSLEGVLMP